MSIAPKRLRTRLTLWYVGTLAAVLALYLVGVSLLLVWQMDAVLKKLAAEDLETVKGLLYFQPDGKVGVREDYHHHTDWKQVQERFLEILAPDGAVLKRTVADDAPLIFRGPAKVVRSRDEGVAPPKRGGSRRATWWC